VRSRPLAFAAAAAALFALSAAVAHRIRVVDPPFYDVRFVPTARSARWLSLGHSTLAADLHWLKTVQYMGDDRGDARGWERLRPLLELVTDLDPRHGYAYQVGANVLASAGLVGDSDAILEKGTRNVPDRYILPFHRAVNAFLYEGDYVLAGQWFERAARTPGAPPHLRDYVVAMYVRGDAAEAAASFLGHLLSEAQDDESRKAIAAQIRRAQLERDASALEEAAARFRERVGSPPRTLEQLVEAGLVPAVPPDPFGGKYVLGADGRVRSTVEPKRFERAPGARDRDQAARDAHQRLKSMEGEMEKRNR